PQRHSASATPTRTTTPTVPSSPTPSRQLLARSAPVRLTIPAIGVDGGLEHLGLSADKTTMRLPSHPRTAGWFEDGPSPGEVGPTIIVGYIATQRGPGVFHRLAHLKAGANIAVRRADTMVVTYRVDQIASYPPNKLPSAKVYGRTKQPALRLITCGGMLRPGQPVGNTVVYAHQVAVAT
ncbi:MAG TPA: sortase, partial [Jatrophihabitantaceae bacterium]|nr:sortase [Jatrophihabitantaceae bacterium]